MARNESVWGIDIGNSSLKALCCRPSAEPGRIEAVAFDYIEHSKIMSQPGAEPAEILAETLREFVSRNQLKGAKVAISISGQNTISRFLKLPPVDVKKVPDIIGYEAKQWLPFDLQDVIWDYQPLGAGLADSGIVTGSEVGMFAMKRDIAMKTLQPYIDANVDVDCIQSSQLAVYNYAAFDQLNAEEIDPENPPEQIIVLNVGTDSTDVIITNGISIWTRSIPIGGNLFTKAMTKTLKLTFTKAEYMKKNAAAAQDPKAIFQAMRPVFNDMLSEVHRSVEYYSSLNRNAKFSKVIALGNAMKMPGLRQFLQQNLGMDVVRPGGFAKLIGPEVTNAPVFKENISSFGVAYGLTTQLLDEAPLTTNLMPQDVVTERIIREKKPWALITVAIILVGLALTFVGATQALSTVERGEYGSAASKADSVSQKSSGLLSKANASVANFDSVNETGTTLTGSVEGRLVWMEFLTALNSCVPSEEITIPDDPEQRTKVISAQQRIYIEGIETKAMVAEDVTAWWEDMTKRNWYFLDEIELLAIYEKLLKEKGLLEDETAPATAVAEDGSETPGGTVEPATNPDGTPVEQTPRKSYKIDINIDREGKTSEEYRTEVELLRDRLKNEIVALASGAAGGEGGSTSSGSGSSSAASGGDATSRQQALFALLEAPPTEGTIRLVQLKGYHYHNDLEVDKLMYAPNYLRETICMNIKHGLIELPVSMDRQIKSGLRDTELEEVSFRELGFLYPVVLFPGRPTPVIALDAKAVREQEEQYRLNMLQRNTSGIGNMRQGLGQMSGASGAGRMLGGASSFGNYGERYSGMNLGGGISGSNPMGGNQQFGIGNIAGNLNEEQQIKLHVYNFVVQFLWYETPPSTRDRIREEKRLAEAEAAAAAGGNAPLVEPLSEEPLIATPDSETTTENTTGEEPAPAEDTTTSEPETQP